MADGNKVKVDVTDNNAKSCDTSFFVPSTIHDPADASITAQIALIAALMTGGIAAHQVEVVADSATVGTRTPAGYNAADKIHCVLRSTIDGSTVIIDIPSMSDQSASGFIFDDAGNVRLANTEVIAMIAFLNANALDTNGGACVFVSAKRTRSERLKTAF
jgi:uncharacterized ferredoxin-like protein